MKTTLLALGALVASSFAGTFILDRSVGLNGTSFNLYQLWFESSPWTIQLGEGNVMTGASIEVLTCTGTKTHNTTFESQAIDCTTWQEIDFAAPFWNAGALDEGKFNVYAKGRFLDPEYDTNYTWSYYGSQLNIRLVISYDADGVFVPEDQSLNLILEDTDWADVHYRINGGAQLNYRMTKVDEDKFKQIVAQALNNGDVISYATTSFTNGTVIESAWDSVVVAGVVDLLTVTYDYTYNRTENKFMVSAASDLQWIDIHYNINGSSQYNYRMSGSAKNFEFVIPQTLNTNDVITYWFTYAQNGQATTTEQQSLNHY